MKRARRQSGRKFIRPFSELTKKDVAIAGGKGASLGEMTQAGFPVPPGFVVLADAFEHFLDEAGLRSKITVLLGTVDPKNMHALEAAARSIRAMLLAATMPPDVAKEILHSFAGLKARYVAVRSSATAEDGQAAAWAGQLESYLNTTQSSLLGNVKKCWASLFTPRAIYYRYEQKLTRKHVAVAVVVQTMVASEVSGIAFSVHPVTHDSNQLVIEAGFGLGEAIVSGKITPDTFVVQKKPRQILEKNIAVKDRMFVRSKNGRNVWEVLPKTKGSRAALRDAGILLLAELTLKIEKHYGFPVDIEWAYKRGRWMIVQSRPVTTVRRAESYMPFSDPANIEKMVRQIGVFPEQETLEVTILPWRYAPHPNLQHWVKYVSTRSKNKLEVNLYWDRKTEDAFLAGIERRLLANRDAFAKLRRYFLDSYRQFSLASDRYAAKGQAFFARQSKRALATSFVNLSRFSKRALAGYYVVYDLLNLLTRSVRQEVLALVPGAKGERLFRRLCVVGIESIIQAERQAFLRRLLRIQALKRSKKDTTRQVQAIIYDQWYEFGECVFSHHTNRQLTLGDYHRKFAKSRSVRVQSELLALQQQRSRDRRTLRRLLRPFRRHPDVLCHIDWLRTMMQYRNCESLYLDAYYHHATPLFAEISSRLGIKEDDLWFLSKEEILGGLRGKNHAPRVVRERKQRGFTIKQVGKIIKVFTGVRPEDWHEGNITRHKEVRGMVAFQGKARGTVRVILHPAHEGANLRRGDILVTAMTTPEFVPLMHKASAVVTDEGGMLCHAAIVARELKKPCIIGTKVASRVFVDGDVVEVDAHRGIVRKV